MFVNKRAFVVLRYALVRRLLCEEEEYGHNAQLSSTGMTSIGLVGNDDIIVVFGSELNAIQKYVILTFSFEL